MYLDAKGLLKVAWRLFTAVDCYPGFLAISTFPSFIKYIKPLDSASSHIVCWYKFGLLWCLLARRPEAALASTGQIGPEEEFQCQVPAAGYQLWCSKWQANAACYCMASCSMPVPGLRHESPKWPWLQPKSFTFLALKNLYRAERSLTLN